MVPSQTSANLCKPPQTSGNLRFLEVCRGLRRCEEGGFWRFPEVCRSLWRFPEVAMEDLCWVRPQIFANLREPPETSPNLKKPRKTSVANLRKPRETSSNLRKPPQTSKNRHRFVEVFGGFFRFAEACRRFVGGLSEVFRGLPRFILLIRYIC